LTNKPAPAQNSLHFTLVDEVSDKNIIVRMKN